MITKLHERISQVSLQILRAVQFEKAHRKFLAGQDEKDAYFVMEPDRICFHDCARLDVIAYFGGSGWTYETGGYVKNVDGVTVKLYAEAATGVPVTLTAKPPFLDCVATPGCKISEQIVHGFN